MKIAALLALLCFMGSPAMSAPRVVVDIAPLHSLTAQVMEGVGAPALILPPGASPHDYAMRPSEAAALASAELVIRIGGGLTPWFDKAQAALASDAFDLELSSAPGVLQLPTRAGGEFGADDHGHDEPIDPHLWLDPENGRAAVSAIAAALKEIDPANAGAYQANSDAARRALELLSAEIEAIVSPVRGRPYLVFHDAYQYFTHRFDIPELGAVSASDAARPGAGSIAKTKALAANAVCVFAEPQFEPRLLTTVTEGTHARIATLDPAGANLRPGAQFYGDLLRALASNLASCLADR